MKSPEVFKISTANGERKSDQFYSFNLFSPYLDERKI